MTSTLGIYPSQILISALSGANVSVPIVFINNSDNTIDADISLRAFRTTSKNDGSVEFYTASSTPKDTASFLNTVHIAVDDEIGNTIKLYPKESIKADLTFSPTINKPVDYYFSVVLSSKPNTVSSQQTIVSIQPAVAANILVSLNQNQIPVIQVTDFHARAFTLGGPQNFNLSVVNAGKTYTSVTGTVSIYDMFGKTVSIIPLRESVLLSSDERMISSMNNTASIPQIHWNGGFLMGYYTVKTNLLADRTVPITANTHFLAIPLVVILFITTVFVLILGVILRILRKLNLKEN